MIVITCITFGHPDTDVRQALAGALDYWRAHPEAVVVWIDDASGAPWGPIDGVVAIRRTERGGYCACVSEIVSTYPEASRYVFVNPDASADAATISELADADADVAVPQVDGTPALLPKVVTPAQQLVALAVGEAAAAWLRRLQPTTALRAPSGAVMSFRGSDLREHPLDDRFFWLEMSEWVLRRASGGSLPSIERLACRAAHIGSSTMVHYPVSVRASQYRAKVCFIRKYGSSVQRALVPIAVLVRAMTMLVRGWGATDVRLVASASLGRSDWRVAR